jgi:hypothetical protein
MLNDKGVQGGASHFYDDVAVHTGNNPIHSVFVDHRGEEGSSIPVNVRFYNKAIAKL